ncbi:hypothetical protein ACFLVM_02635 [Chloroflexota bacterium]
MSTMKRYLILIITILILISGLIVGCGGSVTTDETVTERDEAVAFFTGAFPIITEIQAVSDDWNDFLQLGTTYASNPKEVIKKCQENQSRLEPLQYDLSMLYAPPPLRQLKDDLALSLSTGVETFILGELCTRNLLEDYCYKASYKLRDLRMLIVTVADAWDNGLAHYNIKYAEVLR